MEKTWRWFGRNDRITLDMLRQIGVEGVVTALYDVPPGDVWSVEEIRNLKNFIEENGLRWSVVESLPVPEEVKYASPERDRLIENYKVSLSRLGEAGIKIICYNFMPAIDWVRTDLEKLLPDGTFTLYFDKIRFAYFDCRILKRKGAEEDYTEEELLKVDALDKVITEEEKDTLIDTIIVKTQGFIHRKLSGDGHDPVSTFKEMLALYEGVDKGALRENLAYFLEQVIPVAEQLGIILCVHPDDPPFPVFGLPRIVSNEADISWILNKVKSPSNGLTFCAGSLSAGSQNDVPALAAKFKEHIGFAHLRSSDILDNGDFIESSHLKGRGRLIEVIRTLERYCPNIPMRVDHGRLMLDDVDKGHNPGYSFLGRMLALAQVEGVMAVVRDEINNGFCLTYNNMNDDGEFI